MWETALGGMAWYQEALVEGNERLGKAVDLVDYCMLAGERREHDQSHWPSSFADGGAVLMEMQSSEGTCLWWLCASHKLGKAVTSRVCCGFLSCGWGSHYS